MLFALFIYIVESNKIDVSANTNLYSNEQTMTLLELGMGIFVVWMIILLVIFYLKKADKIFKVKKTEEQDDFDEYINDYNEPKKVSESVNNSFNSNLEPVTNDVSFNNNDIVKSLVPETALFTDQKKVESSNIVSEPSLFNEEKVVEQSVPKKEAVEDIFNGFQFLDVPAPKVERKDDDVEILDIF